MSNVTIGDCFKFDEAKWVANGLASALASIIEGSSLAVSFSVFLAESSAVEAALQSMQSIAK